MPEISLPASSTLSTSPAATCRRNSLKGSALSAVWNIDTFQIKTTPTTIPEKQVCYLVGIPSPGENTPD